MVIQKKKEYNKDKISKIKALQDTQHEHNIRVRLYSKLPSLISHGPRKYVKTNAISKTKNTN